VTAGNAMCPEAKASDSARLHRRHVWIAGDWRSLTIWTCIRSTTSFQYLLTRPMVSEVGDRQRAPKNFLTPLETKIDFANFFDAT
jgi:hypothetical protein